MRQVYKHAAAKRDLVEHFVYLAETAGLNAADRFLLQADESFRDLARCRSLAARSDLG
jgi:toxin ParE1/3/4